MNFKEKLLEAAPRGIGLCVGLDPVLDKMPPRFQRGDQPLLDFCAGIVAATSDLASAYKPNLAFFEAYGWSGWRQLEQLIRLIPRDKIVIADAKRGDIGNTAAAYAQAIFDILGADAVTVHPWLGTDSLEPFLKNPDHGAFILAVTSNPSGRELQELSAEGEPMFQHVIKMAKRLSVKGNVGLVAGATRPELWPQILDCAEFLPILAPGIGAQGGDLEALKKAAQGYPAPMLVNASRSILYASSGDDYQEAAHCEAQNLINQLRA
ncbi:MAG: orotidine-5'-phosphate decarboxylase [Calditrichota bacterium]